MGCAMARERLLPAARVPGEREVELPLQSGQPVTIIRNLAYSRIPHLRYIMNCGGGRRGWCKCVFHGCYTTDEGISGAVTEPQFLSQFLSMPSGINRKPPQSTAKCCRAMRCKWLILLKVALYFRYIAVVPAP